ncbi:MAG: PHP domain-containing protein, partial [Proteobacteria bacterium]|nr:PHP domain-containing protein [Pseudomonadota bacterium]
MPIADFIHLKVRSAYSLTEGANKIDKIVALAKENAMPAVGVTDRNNLFGALEFSQYASNGGVQPIIGCDLAIRRVEEGGISASTKVPSVDWLTLLVQSETGYLNLMRLVSRAHLDFKVGALSALPMEELNDHTDGLLVLTGSVGSTLGRLLAAGQMPAAGHQLDRLQKMFDGRLYLEVQRHGEEVERRIEEPLLDLAYDRGLPIVATNDVHFPKAAMYGAHDVLLCIEQGAHIDDPNRRRLTSEHYFKSAAEMRKLFADLPEACDNTIVVAQRCAYMPAPRKPILPSYTKLEGRSEGEALRALARSGLDELKRLGRLAQHIDFKKYEDRLAYELDMIEKMGFAGYFLIVADFIQWAKDNDVPVGP